ncbi:hypothetical protein LCGC14_0306000 [marine sediment metagenome]|uniref:Uncharacterized protein n=1 Tax=marine sediment metagenome TaxID=412755 RepID=A0A0F9WAP2_9ZZZZ
MYTIKLRIIDIRDIKNFFTRVFDRIKFILSRPKYCVGVTFTAFEEEHTVTSIERDWKYNAWYYTVNNSESEYSESLVYFYLNYDKLDYYLVDYPRKKAARTKLPLKIYYFPF